MSNRHHHCTCGCAVDARAEIERLRAEIELLTGNKWSEIELALADKKAHEMWMYLHGVKRLDDLLDDNKRLRAALETIRDWYIDCGDDAEMMAQYAGKALAFERPADLSQFLEFGGKE